MTARVLVVDDIDANVKLLKARLMAEYFEVITASNGPDALGVCEKGLCDVILLDVMMPGMDGYEVCRRLKSDPRTAHLPVIMVTALDQPSDKIKGLEAGADDFLTKPVNDLALTTRVRSLARLKMVTDELRLRASTGADPSYADASPENQVDPTDGRGGSILIVDDRESSFVPMSRKLENEHEVTVLNNPHEALFRAADMDYDLVIVSLALENFDALRLCSQMRSLDRTRMMPILLVAAEEDDAKIIRAIDLGVNDYISRPIEANELLARVRTQVRRKRLNDCLRDKMKSTMELAVRDALTGLNNRRYFDSHMESLFNKAQVSGRPLALIVVDIDHFKAVNDKHGHQVGDEVLRMFSERLAKSVRGKDLASRYGGEEFLIAMPDTDRELALVVAERMRNDIAEHPLVVADGEARVSITISAGIAAIEGEVDTVEAMISRADAALFEAKRAGRNCVMAQAA